MLMLRNYVFNLRNASTRRDELWVILGPVPHCFVGSPVESEVNVVSSGKFPASEEQCGRC